MAAKRNFLAPARSWTRPSSPQPATLPNKRPKLTSNHSHAMAQTVSRCPLTAEARVRGRVKPCEVCSKQSCTGTGLSPSFSAFPCHYHSTVPPYTYHWGWTTGLLVAAVQRHSVTPSTWTTQPHENMPMSLITALIIYGFFNDAVSCLEYMPPDYWVINE
jgi:hypothetical protein